MIETDVTKKVKLTFLSTKNKDIEKLINIGKLYSQEIMDIIYMYIFICFKFTWDIYKGKFNRFYEVEIIQLPFTDHMHKIII